jgi:CPA2 family monovalent cation:H+ antiporter-2
LIAGITIGVASQFARLVTLVEEWLGVGPSAAGYILLAFAAATSLPFWVGMIHTARGLGSELAERALPSPAPGKLDLADAARRLFVVTLQLAITVIVGAPLFAVTQPFLSTRGATVSLAALATFVALLVIMLWRRATSLQGHVTAASALIAEALVRQTREEMSPTASQSGEISVSGNFSALSPVEAALSGLGKPTSFTLGSDSSAVGKTLAEMNLRGLTGATVLAIRRGEELMRIPDGSARLAVGDVLVLAGTKEASEAARAVLASTMPENDTGSR